MNTPNNIEGPSGEQNKELNAPKHDMVTDAAETPTGTTDDTPTTEGGDVPDPDKPGKLPSEIEDDQDIQAYTDMVHDEYVEIAYTKVSNAQRLLSFALDNALDVDKEVVEKVAEARKALKNPKNWEAIEADFYLNYHKLVKSVYPVTIDKLNKPSEIDKDELSGTIFGKDHREHRKKRTATVYSICTLIFILLLLGVQVFYFLGSTRLNEISSTNEKLEKKVIRQRELQILTAADPNNITYVLELEDNISQCAELNNSLQSNILLLEPWTQIISRMTFNTRDKKVIDTQDKENVKINIEVIQEAKGYALILCIYILPLLYGLIGGLTFVLRELRSDVRKYTLDKESTIKYILRIILGAVAGMSVGLFWSDIENAQAVGFSSIPLSPMLLAFLAGYCVEHVLGFIDKIIKNIFDNLLSKSVKNDNEKQSKDDDASDDASKNGNGGKNGGAAKNSKPAAKTASTGAQQK